MIQSVLSFTLFMTFFTLAHKPVIKTFCGIQFDQKWIYEMSSVMLKGKEIKRFSICSNNYEYSFNNIFTLKNNIELKVNHKKKILYLEEYNLEEEYSQ
ncbi:MAG: hypothetical protein H6622_14805 [Halobacteriovoraceae bacterium]|nr:hypothetical protein [Halobacteriovoraceae bacterium]